MRRVRASHNGGVRFGAYEMAQGVPADVPVDAPKVRRNDPCPCGSGKKFKNCCYT